MVLRTYRTDAYVVPYNLISTITAITIPFHYGLEWIHCEFHSGLILFEEVTMNFFLRRTVTSDLYSRLLENHAFSALRQRSCLISTILMQETATVHIAKCVNNLIQTNFSYVHVILFNFSISSSGR